MSVIMTFRATGDPDELERRAAENPEAMRSIADRAKEHGLIAHMVVDEWPDADLPVRAVETVITFWRKLDTYDDVAWDA